uniref:Uncharacterized protein n=1 Tax=Mus spicilegus TaxID=10103 RepID=A0A8C6GIP4_MUSSI
MSIYNTAAQKCQLVLQERQAPLSCRGGTPGCLLPPSVLDLISRGFYSLLGCFLSARSACVAGFTSALTLVPVTFSLILLQG